MQVERTPQATDVVPWVMPSGLRALALLLLIVVGCSPVQPARSDGTPASPGSVIAPTAGPPTAPPPTPDPTEVPQPIPTSTTVGWWGNDDSGSYCAVSAWHRLDGEVAAHGGCMGLLYDPANSTVTLRVGQDLDVHMTVDHDGGTPRYTLPTSSDPLVMEAWFIADAATMTYRGLSSGTARLMTTGSCLVKDASATGVHQLDGPCPVLNIRVRPVETECQDVPRELCDHAAATAILWGMDPQDPGQHVIRWKASPGSGQEWPGCGRIAVEVTLTLADPERVTTVTVGQVEPDSVTKLSTCTY